MILESRARLGRFTPHLTHEMYEVLSYICRQHWFGRDAGGPGNLLMVPVSPNFLEYLRVAGHQLAQAEAISTLLREDRS